MSQPLWIIPVLLAGLVLMVAGPWVAGAIVPEQAVWTEQDAAAQNEARAKMHAALHARSLSGGDRHQHGSGDAHASPAEAADASEAYESLASRHEAALSRRSWLIMSVRGLGILLVGIGIVAYLIGRR